MWRGTRARTGINTCLAIPKPEVYAQAEEKMKRKKLARLKTLAATLNYQLIPNP